MLAYYKIMFFSKILYQRLGLQTEGYVLEGRRKTPQTSDISRVAEEMLEGMSEISVKYLDF